MALPSTPFFPDIACLLGDEPFSFVLESGMDPSPPQAGHPLGRYSLAGCRPSRVLRYERGAAELTHRGEISRWSASPWNALRAILPESGLTHSVPARNRFPFAPMVVGYLSYDLRCYVEDLPRAAVDDLQLPDFVFARYDAVLVHDHLEKKTWIERTASAAAVGAEQRLREAAEQVPSKEEPAGGARTSPSTDTTSSFDHDQYLAAVQRVQEYIAAGDVYQVNLAQRLSLPWQRTPVELFARLCRVNPAPFSALLVYPDFAIVSASPERFLHFAPQTRIVHTRPIKGTRPRGRTPHEDEQQRHALRISPKDGAEHVMIVDLERNDLGRVCEYGSVRVRELASLETFPTVHHLTSTVEGRLRPERDTIDLLQATFPGGSITGAPKVRAMQIIEELEPVARGVYTGSIGYWSGAGGMDLNIAIRTIVLKDGQAYLHVGGGIVADSNPEAEYQETLDKAAALLDALNG